MQLDVGAFRAASMRRHEITEALIADAARPESSSSAG